MKYPGDSNGLPARNEGYVTLTTIIGAPGGPGAATTIAIPLDVIATCTPVADPQEGSTCGATTTADALAPCAVKEARRTIWQLGSVELDGGADGDANTPTGDTLFATQGLFIP